MKPKVIGFCLLLCTVTFVSSMVGYVFGAKASHNRKTSAPEQIFPSAQKISDTLPEKETSDSLPSLSNEITQTYILREDDGYVRLFSSYSDGKIDVYDTYDINVTALPSADRNALKKGIECKSLSEALSLIEDFS